MCSSDLGIVSVTGSLNYDTGTGLLSLDEGIAGGLATLNVSGVVPDEQLPDNIVRTDGLTGALGDYILLTEKASPNGVATLDASTKVPIEQLPALAITDTYLVTNETDMLELIVERGDVAVRTDVSKSFIFVKDPYEIVTKQLDSNTAIDRKSTRLNSSH